MYSYNNVYPRVLYPIIVHLSVLLSMVDRLSTDQLILLMKTFRHLSMDNSTLDQLEAAGIIARLVPLVCFQRSEWVMFS